MLFSVPIAVNHATPLFIIAGTDATDSTLLTTVGFAYKPAIAGNGGRNLGCPLNPSSQSSKAVSSPQIYAPAPTCKTNSRSKPLPNMFLPSKPAL